MVGEEAKKEKLEEVDKTVVFAIVLRSG